MMYTPYVLVTSIHCTKIKKYFQYDQGKTNRLRRRGKGGELGIIMVQRIDAPFLGAPGDASRGGRSTDFRVPCLEATRRRRGPCGLRHAASRRTTCRPDPLYAAFTSPRQILILPHVTSCQRRSHRLICGINSEEFTVYIGYKAG